MYLFFRLMNIEDDFKKIVNNRTPPKSLRKSHSKLESTPESKNNVNHKVDLNNSNNFIDDDGIFEELFSAVMKAKDDYNKPLYTHFQLLPSKKKYPEYYEVIEQPIDLKLIAQKIQGKKYNNLIEMERDLLLMCKNACLFNEPGSQIHKQAKALKQVHNKITCNFLYLEEFSLWFNFFGNLFLCNKKNIFSLFKPENG